MKKKIAKKCNKKPVSKRRRIWRRLCVWTLIVALIVIVAMIVCDRQADAAKQAQQSEKVEAEAAKPDTPATPAAAAKTADIMTESRFTTPHGHLIRLKPDMTRVTMDLVCGQIPSSDNDSIMLAFAGSFTGQLNGKGHGNIAGDHVAGGKRYHGYRCARNTGAFTWSAASGPRFHYKNYSQELDKAAAEGGMGFAQEMMIHDGKAVKTTRPLGNRNVFRALCLDADGELALYESQGEVTFGNFIQALLSQGVKEALYTDMGPGWNYCFYRLKADQAKPDYLHKKFTTSASNFIVIKRK